jgi:hypothetical protein
VTILVLKLGDVKNIDAGVTSGNRKCSGAAYIAAIVMMSSAKGSGAMAASRHDNLRTFMISFRECKTCEALINRRFEHKVQAASGRQPSFQHVGNFILLRFTMASALVTI